MCAEPRVIVTIFPLSIMSALSWFHGIEHVAAVDQGRAGVEIDRDTERFRDIDAKPHGLG
jgi:hypothetical protein